MLNSFNTEKTQIELIPGRFLKYLSPKHLIQPGYNTGNSCNTSQPQLIFTRPAGVPRSFYGYKLNVYTGSNSYMLYLAIYNLKYIVRLLEQLIGIPGKTGLEYIPILSPALDITFTKHRPRIYASKGHLNCFIQN